MYLKEIKARGFKSFADKTVLEFKEGITGIVGPNGSGKSNVVDAVKWVLGEQSIKSLRGSDNMTDVIFSGSKSRKPASAASVTLIFDNSDNFLPTPFSEVAIKRRVYKDGTNEYFLNEEKVRLKDIIDLLLDNGVTKESFNIISQGKIDEIIINRPSDRRIIFEEAAGVLKYKKRKEEALRKLEKTNNNMNRVNDIIHELEIQIEPLSIQKEKAIKYISAKEEMQRIEVALITSDITNINYVYQDKKGKIDTLNNEVMNFETSGNKDEAKVLSYKMELSLLDEKIKNVQEELLKKNSEVEKLNSQKNILVERKKYESDNTKLHENILNLEENKLKLDHDIHNLNLDISNSLEEYKKISSIVATQELHITNVKLEKSKLDNSLGNLVRSKTILDNEIITLKDNIDNNSSVPYAVKKVLENPKLRGIHNVIGNLIEIDSNYNMAIGVALGSSSSYLIVDDTTCAKEAIGFLKNNNIGRVTFYPLSVIKPKTVDVNTLNILKNTEGFVGIAKDLVKCSNIYQNIIMSTLGNIIIAKNIDYANQISKKINYSYRIVTLDGEVIHVGGSLTGGYSKMRNVITDKYDLDNKLKNKDKLLLQIKTLENNINEVDNNLNTLENNLYLSNKNRIELDTLIKTKNSVLVSFKNDYEKTNNEIAGISNVVNDSLSNEEINIMNLYYEQLKEYDEIKNNLDKLFKKRQNLNENLSELEFSIKRENSLLSDKNKELKELEIEVNRMDVKLDNLLNILSETYNITYENAVTLYKLELDSNVAKNKINSLKRIMKEIGDVNLNAKEEYEKVSTRYEFLLKQTEDLLNAQNTLLEIIEEMDTVMKKEFKKTFDVISSHFTEIFKLLFKGGHAELKLTDSNNLLETGIEIIASPPGKSLKSISLLSGGEKTFTAISLLFAILKSRKVPFCILDEVEAALDEVNVDSFGKYLVDFKKMTQFIIITHKKKTMEYVDYLYGITMQESGVSKLVSVKLEEMG